MADPLRTRDPVGNDPVNPAADPADPRYAASDRPRDPAAEPRTQHTVINAGRSGGGNALTIGVIAAAVVIALLVFMNWSPGTDTAVDPGGAVVEEPAATAPAGETTAPAPAAEDTAPAATGEAPAATDDAPADPAPAPAD